MIPFRPRGSMEYRRQDLTRTSESAAKNTIVGSRVLVLGLGEVNHAIQFPVYFTEVPIISFGGALDVNQAPVAGSFPEVQVIVLTWVKVGEIIGGFDGYYVGATLGIKTKGADPTQRLWVSYTALGAALVNPVNTLGGTTVII